jgi:5-methylcytosine-specific restriction endonuclease McrA
MNRETRMKVIIRDMYTCQVCGKQPSLTGLQIAHRIKSGKGTEKYIQFFLESVCHKELFLKEIREQIIDHPKNLVTTCSLRCNDACNIFNNQVERDKLIIELLQNTQL